MTQPEIQRVSLPGDTDLLALHAADSDRFPGLLQSVALDGSDSGQVDILFALPAQTLRLDGDVLSLDGKPVEGGSFLEALDSAFAADAYDAQAARTPDLPFVGGWMLLLGYELAHQVEHRVPSRRFHPAVPDALAVRCRAAIIRHHATQAVECVIENGVAEQDVQDLLDAIGQTPPLLPRQTTPAARQHCEPADHLVEGIRAVHEYVLAGDVFQVNLSRGWHAEYAKSPDVIAAYQRLSQDNPGPFAGIMQWGDAAVLSSSPERLIRIEVDGQGQRIADTRPIAGTRKRGGSANADAALRAELIAHPKERAEHVMLIDLERNDLGRVCQPGSVEVNEMMVVESYAHVHHIVSNVRGVLRPDVGPGGAIAAVFPGGTITGCPKVRCMQIIAELEADARGPYTGAMGYLGRDGRMDLNILIRTLVFAGRDGWARAGAGIVIDSDPIAEIREMQAKARGLLPALGLDKDFGLEALDGLSASPLEAAG